MYLFYDTETNGLPKGGVSPRIIQLAYILFDENFKILEQYCQLIKPDNWEIPNEKFWIDNGYSTGKNVIYGVPIKDALINFATCIERCQFIIAHNMAFDIPVLVNEMKLSVISANNKPKKLCTMQSTTKLVQAKNKNGGLKWPKLEELHIFLFGKNFDGAHDALEYVKATARCFYKLKKNNLVPEWTHILN